MELNSLRKGNLVSVGGVIMEVICIYEYSILTQNKKESIIIPDPEPIPLSEEIIFKCGFKKYPWFEGVYIKYNDSHLMIRWFKGDLIIFTCYVMESHKEMLHKNIKHIKKGLVNNLHQLQNFYFSNTGQELNTSELI